MNGIALLILTATLGVEYDWQTTDDGQIEYVLIVEPDFIPALGEGSEIRSSVPNELESVQRLCIRIAQPSKGGITPQTQPRKLPPDALRSSRIGLRAAEPVTILWKSIAQPEETNLVRYGYQPTKEGQLEYFVQVDPKLLRTLAPGDEIYTTLAPEAGRTATFVVFSNAKQLPKVPGKPAAAPLAGSNLAGTAPGLRNNNLTTPPVGPAPFGAAPAPFSPPNSFNSPATSPPATSTSFGPPTAPTFGNTNPYVNPNDKAPPLYSPPRSFGVNDDPINDFNSSRVNPAGYGNTQPGATDNMRGFDTNRTDPSRPNLNAPLAGANPPYRNDAYGTNGQQPYNSNQPANDLYPQNFASNQNGNLRNGSQLPTAGNAPYRPAVGYQQDNLNPNLNPNANHNLAGNHGPNGNLQPGYNQPPNPQAVGYGGMNDNQMASLPNNANTLRPDLRNGTNPLGVNGTNPLNPLGVNGVPQEKPWWWLVFTSFLLFVSIGANLYLGWTAAEFYSRYRLAVERLRTSGTR